MAELPPAIEQADFLDIALRFLVGVYPLATWVPISDFLGVFPKQLDMSNIVIRTADEYGMMMISKANFHQFCGILTIIVAVAIVFVAKTF